MHLLQACTLEFKKRIFTFGNSAYLECQPQRVLIALERINCLFQGASVLPPPDSSMPAPLLCAVKRGHHEAAMFLLQRGSPIVLRDSQNRSCLHIAVYTAGLETVRVILQVNTLQICFIC